ncbi:hypothetical protein EJ075_10420 [Mesorhizobium sp. M6A.T.Cr.TU.016.01.1.1]|nr:hypothetical protein EJ075_10420 [Mesorhizobium sp. M6A.T.Cr.TU.016.01.1.1]
MSIGDKGGMQEREKPRWSLPYRLRSEDWWLVDPPRTPRSATLFPFIPKSLPRYAGRIKAAEKVRS